MRKIRWNRPWRRNEFNKQSNEPNNSFVNVLFYEKNDVDYVYLVNVWSNGKQL